MTKRTTLLGALLLAGLPLTAALAQRGVGIGTANPQAQLHLESNGASHPAAATQLARWARHGRQP